MHEDIILWLEDTAGVYTLRSFLDTAVDMVMPASYIPYIKQPSSIVISNHVNGLVIVSPNGNKFRINVYPDTTSVHVVFGIDYDCNVSEMNVIEKECCIQIDIYTKFE